MKEKVSVDVVIDGKKIRLTRRQQQLLAMLNQGLGNREIAEALDLSEHTVKAHCWRLFQRIGVDSRLEAAAWWREHCPTDHVAGLVAAAGAMLAALAAGGSVEAERLALEAAYKAVKGGVA